MTTLLSRRTPSGTRRRCDAKCYNARGETCNCICHGVNHGVGKYTAIENTMRALEEYCKLEGIDIPIVSKEERENPSGGVGVYPLFSKDK